MLNLTEIIDAHAQEIARRLGELPDALTLLRRLRAILAGKPATPWFPVVPFEKFLRGVTVIEESMLARMGWEVEPDPVARAQARAQLRAGLTKLTHLYAAGMDREMATLKARQKTLQSRLVREQAVVAGIQRISSAGVVVLDADGRVLSWSSGATRLTDRNDQVGHLIAEYFPAVETARSGLMSTSSKSPAPHEPEGCFLCAVPGAPAREVFFRLALIRTGPGIRSHVFVLSLEETAPGAPPDTNNPTPALHVCSSNPATSQVP